MFGLGEYTHWYQQPTYFVYGALWYGLTSILFLFLNQHFLLQDKLSQILKKFQPYFKLKHGCLTQIIKQMLNSFYLSYHYKIHKLRKALTKYAALC